MTANRDLKNIIPERQSKTGESYTAARPRHARPRRAVGIDRRLGHVGPEATGRGDRAQGEPTVRARAHPVRERPGNLPFGRRLGGRAWPRCYAGGEEALGLARRRVRQRRNREPAHRHREASASRLAAEGVRPRVRSAVSVRALPQPGPVHSTLAEAHREAARMLRHGPHRRSNSRLPRWACASMHRRSRRSTSISSSRAPSTSPASASSAASQVGLSSMSCSFASGKAPHHRHRRWWHGAAPHPDETTLSGTTPDRTQARTDLSSVAEKTAATAGQLLERLCRATLSL